MLLELFRSFHIVAAKRKNFFLVHFKATKVIKISYSNCHFSGISDRLLFEETSSASGLGAAAAIPMKSATIKSFIFKKILMKFPFMN